MEHMLRDEYRIKQVTKVTADTIEELAEKLEGVNSKNFLETVAEYNKAVKTDVEFNATILDGRGTEGLALPKSNWAHTIEKPPFQAYAVTCGVTYTFGGVKIDTQARVEHRQGHPPWSLCSRRNGRRTILFQLSARQWTGKWRCIREASRHRSW